MEIPNEIMKKICLYRVVSPHPVAILFKQTFTPTLDEMNEIIPDYSDIKYSMDDSCLANDMSFAKYHFHQNTNDIPDGSRRVYYYNWIGFDYVSTLNECSRNREVYYYQPIS